MSAIVVLYFPTVMSGPVLRWYTTKTDRITGRLVRDQEVANAGREGITVTSDCPLHIAAQVHEVAATVDFRDRSGLRPWMSYVTHEMGGFMSDDVYPIGTGGRQASRP